MQIPAWLAEEKELILKYNNVMIIVTGLTGSGKTAICGEIEIALKAIGIPVEWRNGHQEKNLNHADWQHDIKMYKPRVIIEEVNIP